MAISFATAGGSALFIPILLSDLDRMWILYSSVPAEPGFRDWSLFLLLTGMDVFFFCRIVPTAIFSFLTQLLIFQKCGVEFLSFHQVLGFVQKKTLPAFIFSFQKQHDLLFSLVI